MLAFPGRRAPRRSAAASGPLALATLGFIGFVGLGVGREFGLDMGQFTPDALLTLASQPGLARLLVQQCAVGSSALPCPREHSATQVVTLGRPPEPLRLAGLSTWA